MPAAAGTLRWGGLCLQRGREVALRYPDGVIAPGEQVAVTGPSGTGKTSLLHAMAGLLRPAAGTLSFGPLDLARAGERAREVYRRREVGYVFQDFHLMAGLTALENVELGLRVAGRCQAGKVAREVLARLDLGTRLHHLPSQLSTGERQRVAVARAAAHQPRLLLVDEPTAHLDRARAAAALTVLLELSRDLKSTLVVVTHDPGVADALPSRMHLAGPA